MAVYGYVRVSTDAQAEDGESLAVQQRQLEGWGMQHGKAVAAMHVEAGISGAIPFAERPEGGKLWAKLVKGDALIAAKLDRMFRSASDCLNVVETLKTLGVSLYLLDLNGGNRSLGSLVWSGTVTNSGATPGTLTIGSDNSSTTFDGLIQNGVGTTALTKIAGLLRPGG